MNVSSYVDSKYKELNNKIMSKREDAKQKTLKKIIKDTEEYVPYNTGELTNSVSMNVPASSISYNAPYASFAFNPEAPSGRPKNYDRSVHRKAQGYPIQASYEDNGESWAKFFAEELIRGVE
jgi:hypothetical protein